MDRVRTIHLVNCPLTKIPAGAGNSPIRRHKLYEYEVEIVNSVNITWYTWWLDQVAERYQNVLYNYF